jgi:hypothetical protein
MIGKFAEAVDIAFFANQLEGVLFIRLMEYYPHTAIRHFSFVFHIP